MNSKLAALACACALAAPSAASAAVVTISQNTTSSLARDGVAPSQTQTYTGTAIPGSATLTATDGTVSSTTATAFDVVGGQTVLSNGLTMQRGGAFASYARSTALLFFSVDADTSYVLSGRFVVDDIGQTAGSVYLHAELYDFTTASYVVSDTRSSNTTNDEELELGVAGGDTSNTSTGSLTGTLHAGHQYQWFFNVMTTVIGPDTGVTASGHVTLTIGEATGTAVPEPGSLALVLAAGLGALAVRRRAAR